MKVVSESLTGQASEIIRQLQSNPFYTECPHCGDTMRLKDTGLFYLDDFSPRAETLYKRRLEDVKERESELRERLNGISRTSEIGAEAVNIGSVLERIAPSMRGFPFNRNDCRSLFKPIDYLIFEGLTKKGTVSKIVFVDIKTGDATLTSSQREIRKLVERKRVLLDTYAPERA